MPLDAAPFGDTSEGAATARLEARPDGELARLRPAPLVLDPLGDVGEALRRARCSLGLGVEDIAAATRVRPAYVTAIERFDFERLPARAFVVGYVRSYARALGLEPEAVVARFRAEAPAEGADPVAAAGGAAIQGRRLRVPVMAAALVVAALGAWNIVRHSQAAARPAPISSLPQSTRARPAAGPAHLGAPLPAPPEAATPAAYRTPGLGEAAAAVDDGPPPGAPFVPGGATYGVAPFPGAIVLQARKPTSLVVRAAGGAVLFARQLGAGEAWRAPPASGLVADAGNPAYLEVFVGGLARGPLRQAQAPLASLAQAD